LQRFAEFVSTHPQSLAILLPLLKNLNLKLEFTQVEQIPHDDRQCGGTPSNLLQRQGLFFTQTQSLQMCLPSDFTVLNRSVESTHELGSEGGIGILTATLVPSAP